MMSDDDDFTSLAPTDLVAMDHNNISYEKGNERFLNKSITKGKKSFKSSQKNQASFK